jgi:hypothetical protein
LLSNEIAKGTFCAKKQGEETFWSFHNQVLNSSLLTEAENLTSIQSIDKKIMDSLKSLNFDSSSFQSCLQSNEAHYYVQSMRAQLSTSLGMQTLPRLYLNRRQTDLSLNEIEDILKEKLQ